MKIKKLSILLTILAFAILSQPFTAGATTAQQYITQGKAQLFQKTIDGALAAYQTFSAANTEYGGRCMTPGPDCSITEAEEKAKIHGYLAFTRLLELMFKDDGGESPDTITELLALYGISYTGNSFDELDFDSLLSDAENIILPETSPSGETIRSFIAGPLLTALNASIADMDEVIYYCGIASDYGFDTSEIITKEEIGHDADKNIEVDEGDYYLFRAGLKAAKAFALVASAYNLDVDIREIAALINTENFNPKNFLERYTDLLNLLTTSSTPSVDGAGQLADAKVAFLGAIDDYMLASDKIRNDNEVTEGAEELIAIDNCALRSEEWFRTNLTGIQTSLNDNAPFAFINKEETWEFIDGTDTTKKISANFWENMAAGSWHGSTNCDFIGCGGVIDCITINGNQITLEFEGGGPNGWTEATFTGTYNSETGQITDGTYSGTNNGVDFDGTFTATRTNVEEETHNIDLNPFFGDGTNAHNLRDFLPQFNDYGCEIAGTMGHGLGDDPTLGGILPDFTQEDWDLEFGPCSTVNIPVVANGSITINGNLDDWTAQGISSSLFTDAAGNDEPDLGGTDIAALYLAKDDQHLYLAMTLHDGPPSQDVTYSFVAAQQFDEYDTPGERSTEAFYDANAPGWVARVTSRGDWQNIGSHPGDAAPGADVIEWKVPLSEMGNLAGRFIRLYTHSYPASYMPSDEHFTCLRIGPLSEIIGTLNVPEHDGTGPVYIGVFRYDGTYNTDPENRIGGEIIYEGGYTDDMPYTVTDLPVGEQVFVAAMWDADFNGVRSPGDYVAKSGPVTVEADGTTTVNLEPKTMIAGSKGEPYFSFCNVQAMNSRSGVQTALTVQVLDPDGTVPDTLNSLEVAGPQGFSYNFTGQDFVGTPFNVYWHGIPGQPAVGEYTFTVTDTEGKTATSHYYFSGVTNIPLPDESTLQATGDALAPTLSWGAVADYEGNLFYRARIFNAADNSIVWTSGFTAQTSVNVPTGILLQGTDYKWRVEAFDNYTYAASNNRAVSQKVSLTTDNSTPYFNWATVFHRHDAGSDWTQIEVSVVDSDGSVPSSINSLEVYDPQGTQLYSFQSSDYYSGFQEYYTKLPGAPDEGVYKFVVTDTNSNTKTTYDYVAPSFAIPIIDSATLQASGDSLAPTLSWGAPPGMDRPLYFRAIVEDSGGNRVWGSSTVSNTSVQMPSGRLQSGGSYQWYVRTIDDSKWGHFSNQGRSAKVDLTMDYSTPFFNWAAVYQRHDPDGVFTALDAGVSDPNGTLPGAIQSITVTGPNEFSKELVADGQYYASFSEFFLRVPGAPAPGVYTFTVVDNEGKTAVTYEWVGESAEIPIVEQSSISVTGDPLAPTLSWSGISGYQGKLFYRIWVQDIEGSFVYMSSREPYASQTIPGGKLQAGKTYLARVEAYDHRHWTVYNSRSNSNYAIWTPTGEYGYEIEARSQNWSYGQQYIVHFEVEDPNHAANSVTITGPGITDSLILDHYDPDEGSWNSWQSTGGSLDLGSNPPTPPLEYTFTITDSSETTVDTFTVQSFVSVYATDLSPSGTASDPLVFSWTGVGSGYTYSVELNDAQGDRIWNAYDLTTTSVSYDGPALTSGAPYTYWVVVEDPEVIYILQYVAGLR